jgi:polynucleotide 5'-kinase involved in rRNA processing
MAYKQYCVAFLFMPLIWTLFLSWQNHGTMTWQSSSTKMSLKNENKDDGWASIPKRTVRRQQRRDPKWSIPICVEYISPTPSNSEFQQCMLLLVGLPGSGKSTFARALERAMPYKVRNKAVALLDAETHTHTALLSN